MNQSPEKVLHYLAGTKDIKTVSVDDLQKLAAESPYFPIAQFLLAKKLKDRNEGEFLLQVQKTALYFSNQYWLEYQLTEKDFGKDRENQAEIRGKENGTNNNTETEDPIIELASVSPTHIATGEVTSPDNAFSATLPEIGEIQLTEVGDEKFQNAGAIAVTGEISNEETELAPVRQAEEELVPNTTPANETPENFVREPAGGTPNTGPIDIILPNDLSPAAEIEVVELKEEMAGVLHERDDFTEKFLAEAGNGSQKHEQPADDEHDRMFQNIKAMLDASSAEADADTTDAPIAIDPYYTIDYFASQGIKLELDQDPKDQLGQNLKKFTHWLRHMKKLGPEDATEVINRTESDADIQQIADSSNTVREVVTEAMASVLEKQGKKDKAIELYNKLSFLNPDKSAYFADKIKKLKGI